MEYGNYGIRDSLTGASWGKEKKSLEWHKTKFQKGHWHLNDPGTVPIYYRP